MSGAGLPLSFSPLDAAAEERAHIALVLTSNRAEPTGYAVVRHADAAARAQGGACPCCRVASDLVAILRRLFIARVRGEVDFASVLVSVGDWNEAARLREEAAADTFIAARYALAR